MVWRNAGEIYQRKILFQMKKKTDQAEFKSTGTGPQSEDLLSPSPCDYIPGLLLISLKQAQSTGRSRWSQTAIGLDRSRHTTAQQEFASLSRQHIHTHVRSLLLYLAEGISGQSCSIRSRTGADRSMQGLFPNRSCLLIHRP